VRVDFDLEGGEVLVQRRREPTDGPAYAAQLVHGRRAPLLAAAAAAAAPAAIAAVFVAVESICEVGQRATQWHAAHQHAACTPRAARSPAAADGVGPFVSLPLLLPQQEPHVAELF
jgi:hypothetical protein